MIKQFTFFRKQIHGRGMLSHMSGTIRIAVAIRNLLLLFIMLTLAALVKGQDPIDLKLSVLPPYNTSKILNYFDTPYKMILTIRNTTLSTIDAYIDVKITDNAGITVSTDKNYRKKLTLARGEKFTLNQANYNQIINTDHLVYKGITKDQILQGIIPENDYMICIAAYDLKNSLLSAEEPGGCVTVPINAVSPPEIILPGCNEIIQSTVPQNILFSWSMPVGALPTTKYTLKIVELLANQVPMEAIKRNLVIFEKSINVTTYLLSNADPILLPGKTYAFAVKATEPGGKINFRNEGMSEVCSFRLLAAGSTSKLTPPTGDIVNNDTIHAGQNGEFSIIVSSVTKTNGKFSGEGTTFINWLKARVYVEFDTITVDASKNLVTGNILAKIDDNPPVYPKDWALEAAANLQLTNSIASDIISWVNSTANQSIPFNNLQEYTTPVKLPLGVNFPDGNQLAMTEMVFRSDKSEFNLVAVKTTPPSWGTTQKIGFKAKNIRFHPSNIETPPQRIELVEDISIGNTNNDIVFLFKKPAANHSGCYAEWDNNGFSEYGLEIEAQFTRDWLIPSPDDNGKVSATLSVVGTEWNDLILTGTLERCEIAGTQGLVIQADSLAYDMSDVLNPSSITFPENYKGETSKLFRGFYMKELSIELPSTWQTFDNSPPKISIQNMIIDDLGITLYAEATNVIQFPKGKVADLEASIDTVHVEIEAGSLTEAGIKGRIGLPVSKSDSIQNPLRYIGLFNPAQNSTSENSFQLTIEPTGPINAHLLKGQMVLAKTSNIVAYVDKTKKTFNMVLNGEFSWDKIKLGPIKNISMGLKFQGIGLDYNSTNSSGLVFNPGTWSFASPQKFLADFPVTINSITYTNLACTTGQLMHGKLNFNVVCNLSEDIGGMTKMGVEMAIGPKSGIKFYPTFVKATIDSISIHANLAAVKIDGNIGFRSDDPIFGNGFIGTLSADFKAISLKIKAKAEFGNTSYQYTSLYRYWRVEAEVTLPPPGVPFLPGIALRGFGGGAYSNMKATLAATTYTFTPKKSTLGFIAKAVIATSPKEETFNTDVGLLAEFSKSQGLTFIAFTGDFYVGAGFSTRNKAKIKGGVSASYDFPQKHFKFSVNVNVNAPPITTPSPMNLVLDINGKSNEWFFKFGEPGNLNTVNVGVFSLYEYLMFGNKIPYPDGFTSKFTDAYKSIFSYDPNFNSVGNGGVGGNTETGKGFALGIGFKFDKDGQFHLLANYFATYQLGAGAELNLSFMEYSGSCDGNSPIGINGWRATGGLGFYGTAGAWVKRIVDGEVKRTWPIAIIKAGAWIYGEFPNPYYVTGAIDGNAKVLGIFNRDFHREFEKGTKCTNGNPSGGAPVAQGDVAADQQQLLIQYVNPVQPYNFPITTPIAVKFGLIPDETFDVSEQQSSGIIKNRVFKMVITKKLEIKDDVSGTYSNVMLNQNQNTQGEYLYTAFNTNTASPGNTAVTLNTGGFQPGLNTGTSLQGIQNMTLLSGNYSTNINTYPSNSGTTTIGTYVTTYPSKTVPPGYENLPPEPAPVPNSLITNKNYRFTVSATLKELVANQWVDALKRNGTVVTQTVVKTFRTGPMETISYSAPAGTPIIK